MRGNNGVGTHEVAIWAGSAKDNSLEHKEIENWGWAAGNWEVK